MKVFVDASRNRSGGAIEYLVGVFGSHAVREFQGEIHLFAPSDILSRLSNTPANVTKRTHWMIERNLVFQVLWQALVLPLLAFLERASIIFSTDASTTTLFPRHVVMSQDLLSYEDNIASSYPRGPRKIRIRIIYHLQNLAFKRASGVIFLTRYASKVIQKHCGLLKEYTIIPHGISQKQRVVTISEMSNLEREIRIVYVSNAAPYKNQWHVIEAIGLARNLGYNLHLTLVGGGDGPAQEMTSQKIADVDPKGAFVQQLEYLPRAKVEEIVRECDIYLFASSCENLPITLLEGMALGLPIASSDRGPMPDVLLDGGEYFDPEQPKCIARAIISLIENDEERLEKQEISYSLSKGYSWEKTAQDTLNYLKSHC